MSGYDQLNTFHNSLEVRPFVETKRKMSYFFLDSARSPAAARAENAMPAGTGDFVGVGVGAGFSVAYRSTVCPFAGKLVIGAV